MAAQTMMASSSVAVKCQAPRTAFSGLARVPVQKARNTFAARTVSNGMKTRQMMVWQPTDNKFFETLSFLPPLSQDEIARQVDYVTRNGWTPCLEFAEADSAYVASHNTVRMGNVTCNYFDNRYWTMYKLPMFGCSDSSQVLGEVQNASKTFPTAYIRLVAFDSKRQVQVAGFLVHRPASANDFQAPDARSV
ncbi:hypothetical protein WJX74_001442 [Apatococcus lobatus]|uniref:Ribulose bisphosphate carboxylase small subunit, chloroplastic n=2 Tax=Apatococcus TaxID=904362 RepID=A0AAW1TJ67_9CHLO